MPKNYVAPFERNPRPRAPFPRLRNIFLETTYYEEVYLHAYGSIAEANRKLGIYFEFYNRTRPHQSLERLTPDVVYFGTQTLKAAA